MADGLLYQLTESHAHPPHEPDVEARRDVPLILRLYSLQRRQWVVLIAVALMIIVVNKGVIHDHGSNWFGLGMVAFFVGLVAAHFAGWVGLTLRVGREPDSWT